ncbi:molybdopterin-dependent oxidoreductase [Effusibacillus consociatus]|uniref:Molybdopterin-dependent oxidoreductase n=1 Tax=Effusibacillus consociatus TaxID=1117041 RepID=A0ABV9Q2M8_9BACL
MNKRRVYFYLHLFHGLLILLLLLTGAVFSIDPLRTLFGDAKWEIRQVHSILGIVYFLFILLSIPYIVQYLRSYKHWQKTFHICLMISLGLGWTVTGVYLWMNITAYLGIRQLSIMVHDALSLFVIPWILGHITLWYLRKTKKVKRAGNQDRDRGILIHRRDVIMLFGGALTALVLGGIVRWYQPISERFLAGLDVVKRRGYFRIYSVRSDNPPFDPTAWRLVVDGLVEQPGQFSLDELMKLPKQSYVRDFNCVTGWSVTGVEWDGILFHAVADRVGLKPGANYVKMYSADQLYTETYELSQLLQQNVILAYRLDGKPLNADQGAPLRLFHPDMYGYKSIKWLNRIEFTNERGLGYWEEKEGYDLNGYIA